MSKKVLIVAGIALVFAVALGTSGLFLSSALAQGPTPNQNGAPGYAACHNNTAALQLLSLNAQELLAQRQAGKSLLDIAKATGADEAKLVDALIQPMAGMHTWMAQNYPQSNVDQMTQYMRDWIAKDIREPTFGTMTDFRLGLGRNGAGYGMKGGAGPNGQPGYGMMGGFTGSNGSGGMMGGWTR